MCNQLFVVVDSWLYATGVYSFYHEIVQNILVKSIALVGYGFHWLMNVFNSWSVGICFNTAVWWHGYMSNCSTQNWSVFVTHCWSTLFLQVKYRPIQNILHKFTYFSFRCVICMGEFKIGEALRYLPCMHTYHKDCIDDWLMRSFTCPSCMEPVDAALLSLYETNWWHHGNC